MSGVHTRGLSRDFRSRRVVDGIDIDVSPGELFGLIGPDGAGKTTLLRMLVTLLTPSDGEAEVDGLDVVRDYRAIRRRVGYMPGRFSLYTDLSVEENLRFFASIFGTTVASNYEVIRPIFEQLEPFLKRRAGALSGGMKQKLALSCALVHRPKMLFLDEPTTGVDAVSREEFWDVLDTLKKSGLTLMVSTPYMDEAARCDRVALMQDGRLLGVDTPSGLRASFDRPMLAVRTTERRKASRALESYPGAVSVHLFGADLHLTTGGGTAPGEVEAFLREKGVEARARPVEPQIEDVFMARMAPPEA